ncbi:hypothetical protein ACK32R_21320 [Aeromonas dhakensis]|jgi:hypothetical protein|uniref:hypothetical protein n=1 Tax=Aeromonas dhakensis TaxID=196024 RepID=UPI0039865DB8
MNDFGLYITFSGDAYLVRVPGTRQRKFLKTQKRAAIVVRDMLAASKDLDPYGPTRRIMKVKKASQKKKDASLPSGVTFSERDQAYRVVWREGEPGARVTKYKAFSINQCGSDSRARSLAISLRDEMVELHYKNESPVKKRKRK